MEAATTNLKPLKKSERMIILDFIRGIAIFGILIVNMAWFNAPLFAQMGDMVFWDDLPNRIARLFILLFFESKFYPLFAVLFGIGFYFFIRKASDNLRPVVFRYRMRLLYLLIFGILHVVFLWHGDILIIYALFGFVMTWFHKSSDKTLLVVAGVFVLLPIVMVAGLVALLQLAMHIPEAAEPIKMSFAEQEKYAAAFVERAVQVYRTGSFGEIMRVRLTDYTHSLNGILFIFPNIVSLFLIGFYMGRKQVFQDIPNALRILKKVFYWCLPIAIVFTSLYAYASMTYSMMMPSWGMLMIISGSIIGGMAQMFVYLYLLTLAYHKGIFRKLADAIAKVGRMAFTNYLMQSVICTTIAFSYGLGLYGQINYWQGILLTVLIYAVQVVWSHYWLNHFRFGPFEWLWRTLTYGKIQPMRLEENR